MSALLTGLVIILMLVAMAKNIAGPDVIFFGGLMVLVLCGVLPLKDALAGFSNKGMIAVALLFVVGQALENSGLFHKLVGLALGHRNNVPTSRGLVKLMVPVAFLSAFLNNTPIVTILTPAVKSWARKTGQSSSRYLIPLSYATILGGTLTLIGTSTNLVVHGLMLENGLSGLDFFELGKVGLPLLVAGVLYVSLAGWRFLPERTDGATRFMADPARYLVELTVPDGCPLHGMTVGDAGLRNLPGVFLTHIERNGLVLPAVGPERRLSAGDRLCFAGQIHGFSELIANRGLVPAMASELQEESIRVRDELYEVVIPQDSPLRSRTLKDAHFRGHYNASVLAMVRDGSNIQGRLGDVRLAPGDSLLLLASKDFTTFKGSKDFIFLGHPDERARVHPAKAIAGGIIVLAMVLAVTLGELVPSIPRMDMVPAAALAIAALLAFRVIDAKEVRKSVGWGVVVTIAASFGISSALVNSGLAGMTGGAMVDLSRPLGPVGALAILLGTTMVLTELITNNAAAALMVPLGLSCARDLGMDPLPFMVAVAIGSSLSFSTPIGYQTNLIVQGAGGYRFSDFLRIGIPLSLIGYVTVLGALIFWYF